MSRDKNVLLKLFSLFKKKKKTDRKLNVFIVFFISLELAKKLQDEENQRAGAAAAATNAASNRRNQRAADACTSTGARRTRDRERDKDGVSYFQSHLNQKKNAFQN